MAEENEQEVGKSWYTKYRPVTMEQYCGPAIKELIKNRFTKRSNMPHVIMIYGNRGCGKTTLARILSKYYLCENPHEDGTPCEECDTCQSINEILIGGESMAVECPGVIEVDATTANGKEAIQEVIDDALQPPVYTKYKIIIFDECHMISAAAQNSLLKVIEDIPSHLVVIFATTNPEKVLQTIKSRCQLTIEAKKQSVQDMASRLEEISILENLEYSKDALQAIAKAGNRVPRECICLLEAIAKTYNNSILIDNVQKQVGGITSQIYMDYFSAANKGLVYILEFVRKLKDTETKISDFVAGLNKFVLDSMYIKHGISLDDYPTEYIKSIKDLFSTYTSSDFDTLMQIIQYMTYHIREEQESENEVLLVTTAMRISKVDMLAKGLNCEQSEAINENKISLVEHSKKLKANNEEALEKLKFAMDLANEHDEFEGIHQVNNSKDILDTVKVNDIISFDTDSDSSASGSSSDDKTGNSAVDEFFS